MPEPGRLRPDGKADGPARRKQNETVLTQGETTYTCTTIASLGTGNRCGDPRFLRPAWGEEGDYHLQAGSPAIDADTADGAPTVDLENRPRDARPDIGAYEYRPSAAWLYLPLVVRD